jgi:type IV pilus assembly protein PilX
LIHRTTKATAIGTRGIALPVVLMLLLALTGLVLFSARYASMSERTSRNHLDVERARQSAESALRDAERDIRLPTGAAPTGAPCTRGAARPVYEGFSAFTLTCLGGQCETTEGGFVAANWNSATTAEPWWPDDRGGRWNNTLSSKPARGSSANCTTFTGGVPLGTYTGVDLIPGVARQPEYLIELIDRGSGTNTFFRITARGFGASEQTQVVMQSYFRPFELQ